MWFAHFIIDYILILSALFYSSKVSWGKLRDKIYLFLIAIPLIAFSSLRYAREGSDTAIYLYVFSQLTEGSSLNNFVFFEPGYLLFTKIITYFTNNEQIFLLIVNILFIWLFWHFIKKYSISIWMSVFLFIGMEVFDQSMNLIRQLLSVAIVVNSYQYLRNRSYIKFSLFVLLASTFHFTSLVFFLALLVHRFVLKKKLVLIYFIILAICFLFSSQLLLFVMGKLNIYGQYLESDVFNIVDQPKLACILHLFIDILIFCLVYCWGKTKEGIKDNDLMLKLIMIGSIFWALSVNFSTIGRLAMYFDVFSIILIPNVIFSIRLKGTKLLIIALVIILFSVKYFIISYYRPDWFGIYPYKFYFEI